MNGMEQTLHVLPRSGNPFPVRTACLVAAWFPDIQHLLGELFLRNRQCSVNSGKAALGAAFPLLFYFNERMYFTISLASSFFKVG